MGSPIEEGTIKNDFYYTRGGNNHQAIYSYETKPIETPIGNLSAAIGTDYKLDDGGTNSRTIGDLFLTLPIIDHIALKGRIRTNYSSANPTTQFRGGIQANLPITDRFGCFAQVYGADKLRYKGKKTEYSPGAFAGFDYKFNDRTKMYAEVQQYDLRDTHKDNFGVNIGFKYTF